MGCGGGDDLSELAGVYIDAKCIINTYVTPPPPPRRKNNGVKGE